MLYKGLLSAGLCGMQTSLQMSQILDVLWLHFSVHHAPTANDWWIDILLYSCSNRMCCSIFVYLRMVWQVLDARASSAKAQLLLKNVAERKKQKQAQRQGLVILEASYGDIRAQEQGVDSINDSGLRQEDDDSDLPPPYLDVTIPLQFLVDDSGQLQVWFPIPSPLVFPLLLNPPIHLP